MSGVITKTKTTWYKKGGIKKTELKKSILLMIKSNTIKKQKKKNSHKLHFYNLNSFLNIIIASSESCLFP
jgi:hypothetical protein